MKTAAKLVGHMNLGVVLDIRCPDCGSTLLSIKGEKDVQCEFCREWFNINVTIEIEEV